MLALKMFALRLELDGAAHSSRPSTTDRRSPLAALVDAGGLGQCET